MKRRAGGMDRGLEVARASLTHVRASVRDLHAVDRPLRPSDAVTGREREGRCRVQQEGWQASADPVYQPCATRLSRCEPGVCVGGETADVPADKVAWARWGTRPTGHARRLHGRRHAGMRIVQHGPTWLLALDAPVHHEGPWMADHLQPYGHTRVPASQQQAVERGKLMRKARSRKKRHALLADLENRYLNAPEPLGGSFIP